MFIRVKRIAPSKSIYTYHCVILLLSLSMLFPRQHAAIPIFILVLSLMAISIPIFPRAWKLRLRKPITRKKNRLRKESRYEEAIRFMLVSALAMLMFVFCIEYVGAIDIAIAFAIFSFILMYIATWYYMSNTAGDKAQNKDKQVMSWSVRGVSLVISYLILSWAKVTAMGYMDMTYTDASSRFIIYAYAIILLLIVSIPVSGLIYMAIILFETKVLERVSSKGVGRKRSHLHIKYDPLPIALPLILIITPLLMCYGKHHRAVDTFMIKKSIEWDSAEGFYCDGYKVLAGNQTARFIKVADKDYRVFIFTPDDVSSYRLSCQNTYPYYKMQFVLTKMEDIRVQMKMDELDRDLMAITHKEK